MRTASVTTDVEEGLPASAAAPPLSLLIASEPSLSSWHASVTVSQSHAVECCWFEGGGSIPSHLPVRNHDSSREGAVEGPGTELLVRFRSATGRLVPTFAGFDRRMNSRIASAPCRGSPAALVPHRDNRKGPRNFQTSDASSLRRTSRNFFFSLMQPSNALIDKA